MPSQKPTQAPPKVITVFNQKGGCAKTMTAMQLAGTYGHRGYKVLVADVDPQNTAALWSLSAQAATPFPATVLNLSPLKEHFVQKLLQVADNFEVIIIDCPPALGSNVPWSALTISDMAIVPVIPVMDNVWASKAAEDLIIQNRLARVAAGNNSPLEAAYLFSMVRRGTVFTECRKNLQSSAQIPILKESITMRNVFPECQLYGCSVHSFGPSAAAAMDEVNAVADRIAETIHLKKMKVKK